MTLEQLQAEFAKALRAEATSVDMVLHPNGVATLTSGGTIQLGHPRWDPVANGIVTVSYTFLETLPSAYRLQDERFNFAPMSQPQRDATIAALNLWSEVANIQFTPSTSINAKIRIGTTSGDTDATHKLAYDGNSAAWAYGPGGPTIVGDVTINSPSTSGDVWINNTQTSNDSPAAGNFGFMTLIHEIGHAIALKHPGNYNAGGDNTAPGPFLPAEFDNTRYTVMSYHDHPQISQHVAVPETPMLLDIRAVQSLYGANTATGSGNNTYNVGASIMTIWDGGGTDVIDSTSISSDVVIELVAGTYSSVGLGLQNNIAIAYNVNIENARTGGGNDWVIGNDLSNRIETGAGVDTLIGLGGNDRLLGGVGSDTYLFSANWGVDVIEDTSPGGSIIFGAAGTISALQEGNNLLLSDGGANRLTVQDYFAAGPQGRGWTLQSNTQAIVVSAGDPADPGNTKETAKEIGALSAAADPSNPHLAIHGTVGGADTNDFYQFDVRETSRVVLTLSNTGAGNANLQLLNDAGTVNVSSTLAGTDTISRELDAGTYYGRVFTAGASSVGYNLSATADPTDSRRDNTDDTKLAAKALRLNAGLVTTVENWVGRGDALDFYKFSLGGVSNVALKLGGLAFNADLQLLDSAGALVPGGSSAHTGTADEELSRTLAAGEYFVRVNAVGTAQTSYQLSVSAETVSLDGAGNTLARANVTTGILDDRPKSFSDWVSARLDAVDLYKFSVAGASSRFSARLFGLSADADLLLLDSTGTAISGASSARTGILEDTITRSLAAGDYYLRVKAAAGAETNYQLSVSAPPVARVDGGGNTRELATLVPPLDERERVVNDWISGRLDPRDYYKFTLSSASTVKLGLSGLSADANLALLDSAGAVIRSSAAAGTANEEITRSLAAGVYFARVQPAFLGSSDPILASIATDMETNYRLTLSAPEITVDGAGSTLATANNVGLLDARVRPFSDSISAQLDAVDLYKFSVVGASSAFSARLTGLSANADLQLLDSAGAVIRSSAAAGTANEQITRSLAAGDYYLRVKAAAGADTHYELSLSAPVISSVDGGGNTRALATVVRPLDQREVVINDWISGRLDPRDYYKFTLSSASTVKLGLSGLSADANLALLDSAGTVIRSPDIRGSANEEITRSLAAGVYYVRIQPNNLNSSDPILASIAAEMETNYRLTLSAPETTVDGAGNTLATANNVGLLDARVRAFSDSISAQLDAVDLYKFSVAGASSAFSAQLSGLSANADLQLLDSAGTVIRSSAAAGTASEEITRSLAAGDYYLRVKAAAGADTHYQLNLSAPPIAVADGAGNTLATAKNLGSLDTRTRTATDWVSAQLDTADLYKFSVSSVTAVDLRLSELTANANLQLLDSAGTVLRSSSATGTQDERITRTLAAGDYYLRVLPAAGVETGFRVSLAATERFEDGAGNTIATANSRGALFPNTAMRSVSDWVGAGLDTRDFYRFDLSTSATVNLVLSHLTADADLRLLNAFGTEMARSENSGTANDQITLFLASGFPYYVRVAPATGAETRYQLGFRAATGPNPAFLDSNGADNSAATARNVGTLSATPLSYTDSVGTTDIEDWYRFTLATAAQASLTLNGLSADADLYLFGSDGVTDLAASELVGTLGESISRTLAAGTYYVQVAQFGGDTPYTLSFAAQSASADLAGDTAATARNIGALSGTLTFSDRVDTADVEDWYRFTLATAAKATFTLNGLSADADLYLVGSDGVAELDYSENEGVLDESISRTLAAGTYYVQVAQFDGDTPYTLTFTSQSVPADLVGDTAAAAKNIGALSGTLTFSDLVSPLDTEDWYRFALATPAQATFTLGGLGADADLYLVGSDGVAQLAASEREGILGESISRTLAAGTYYVLVKEFGGDTPYTLTLTGQGPGSDGAGNTIAAAKDIGPLSGTLTFSDRVGPIDTDDYYRFTLATAAQGTFRLAGLSADADLYLIGSDGVTDLAASEREGVLEESISRTLAAGTYYVLVEEFGGDTPYTLTFTGQGPGSDGAGNTFAAAKDIGALSGTLTFSDRVGPADTEDWYRFTLAAPVQGTFKLGGLSADADLYLIGSDGGTDLAASEREGILDESISRTLAAGTYYVLVNEFGGDTPYTLTFTAEGAGNDLAGNTIAAAKDIGALSGTLTFSDRVGPIDTDDYYRFTLATAAEGTFKLTGLSADADLYLIGSDGVTELDSSEREDLLDESIGHTLQAGTYYVLVEQFDGDTPYTLTFTSQDGGPDGAGNTIAAARDLGALGEDFVTLSDRVSATDVDDYYRFTVSRDTGFGLALDGLASDADVYLLDSAGHEIDSSTNPDAESEFIGQLLSAGTYYVRVTRFSGSTGYDLAVGVFESPDSNAANAGPSQTSFAAEIRKNTVSSEVFRAGGGAGLEFYIGGGGADRYFAVDGRTMIVDDQGNSAGDEVIASGIGLDRSTSRFAEIGGRHLVAYDLATRQSFVIYDWRTAQNGIEAMNLSGANLTQAQFASAMDQSTSFRRLGSWDDMQLSQEVSSWDNVLSSVRAREGMLAASNG